jgi:tetrahydromethanopterin S-methyltransferase subunit F
MPELTLHFAVLFALSAPIIGVRKAVIVSFVSLLPDLDFLFNVHRSISHSAVLLLAGVLVAILLVKEFRPSLLLPTFVGGLSLLSHPIMDLFSGATPFFWPIVRESVSLHLEAALVAGRSLRFEWTALVKWSQTPAPPAPVTDSALVGPIFTSEGFISSLMLVAIPIMMRLLRQRPFRSKG